MLLPILCIAVQLALLSISLALVKRFHDRVVFGYGLSLECVLSFVTRLMEYFSTVFIHDSFLLICNVSIMSLVSGSRPLVP
jgi:hypothetical protein